MEMQQAALGYAARGRHVFPLKHRQKTPATRHGVKDATTDSSQVAGWFNASPSPNIGCATGQRSGFWSLDIDGIEGEETLQALEAEHGKLPATVELITGGGRQLFFRCTVAIGNSVRKLGPGLDTRGEGGYTILPPSIHPSGRPYAWSVDGHPDEVLLAEAPDWLVQKIQRSASSAANCNGEKTNGRKRSKLLLEDRDQQYIDAALDGELADLRRAPEGQRNDQLNRAAFNIGTLVGGGYLDRAEAERHLIATAHAIGLERSEVAKTVKSGLDAGEQQPRVIPESRQPSVAETKSGASVGATPNSPPNQDWHSQTKPVDLWGSMSSPEMPKGVLPPIVERFALQQADLIGADPGGLAMAVLGVCSAAITDRIKIQVKRHDPTWRESARIWVALIGAPSSKKSPILASAVRPLAKLDAEMYRAWFQAKEEYDALPDEEREEAREPKRRRLKIEDTTVEAAQGVLKSNPDGVLCSRDELGGWFGALDKYSGGKGSGVDRGFWLQAFNGGSYSVDRVGRGSAFIENLSVSLIGGIQPAAIRKLAADSVDDGLLQRLFPVILRPATIGNDEPSGGAAADYDRLIRRLVEMTPQRDFAIGDANDVPLRFDDGAQQIRRDLELWNHELQALECLNPKLAAHIGKLDGLFARLCVTWHCIENSNTPEPPEIVQEATARRVAEFMRRYLLGHACAFYAGTLGLSDDHDRLAAVAGYILAHKLERVTNRDIQRGDRTMRGLTKPERERVFEQLHALGWLDPEVGPRATDPLHWVVNPECHRLFADRADKEAKGRKRARAMVADVMGESS